MVLTNLSANQSSQIGDAMQFTATLSHVRFVSSSLISLSEADLGGIAGAAGATNLGKQAAGAASSATSSNGSILFSLFGP